MTIAKAWTGAGQIVQNEHMPHVCHFQCQCEPFVLALSSHCQFIINSLFCHIKHTHISSGGGGGGGVESGALWVRGGIWECGCLGGEVGGGGVGLGGVGRTPPSTPLGGVCGP